MIIRSFRGLAYGRSVYVDGVRWELTTGQLILGSDPTVRLDLSDLTDALRVGSVSTARDRTQTQVPVPTATTIRVGQIYTTRRGHLYAVTDVNGNSITFETLRSDGERRPTRVRGAGVLRDWVGWRLVERRDLRAAQFFNDVFPL